MSGSGRFDFTRGRGGDRFYYPPAVRRLQQQLLKQQQLQQLQQQLQRPLKTKALVEEENRTESEDSTSSKPSICSSPHPPSPTNSTNLDRFLESTTPFVQAQYFSKTIMKGWRSCEDDFQPFFSLEDLWESFKEWSAYGAGVPLVLNGSDSVVQYYVPYLSGIQLYIDPSKPSLRMRRPGEESDAESSSEASSDGSSDYEAERRAKCVIDGAWSQHNHMDSTIQRMYGLSLREKPLPGSSSNECEFQNPPGLLIFEYLEQDPPYCREPLADKASPFSLETVILSLKCIFFVLTYTLAAPCIPQISVLASRFPELRTYKSCDLLPASTGNSQLQHHSSSVRKGHSAVDMSSKLSLPIFGLASYKFKGSIWTPNGIYEHQQANSLLQAAGNWLRLLQVDHPDYLFFVSHNTYRSVHKRENKVLALAAQKAKRMTDATRPDCINVWVHNMNSRRLTVFLVVLRRAENIDQHAGASMTS
ncbi:hypothetical protein HHK36_020832 [Tetracentron sinense]|uniref:Uncharacterized protein n=1 Tax=Tetracentron sinense TaxID=13715 RepID=A0A835D8Q7_TETSI|nr:hypothetical protein HHK36_020832 [Tetracentron sinense]